MDVFFGCEVFCLESGFIDWFLGWELKYIVRLLGLMVSVDMCCSL